MNLIPNPNIDFLHKKYFVYAISSLLLIIGIVYIFMNGGFKYNIDFSGGLSLEISPDIYGGKTLSVTQIREVLNQYDFSDATIQELPNTNSFLIKIKSEGGAGDRIVEALKNELGWPHRSLTMAAFFIQTNIDIS